MSDAEKALLKELGHELVDKFLPEFIAAETGRIPAEYAAIVSMIATPLVAKLQAFLDAKIETVGA